MKAWTYARWRLTVPWTNAQVAGALRAEAARLPDNEYWGRHVAYKLTSGAEYLERTGSRLSSKLLALALPALVTTCAICGKPAHYRLGTYGRCRVHRAAPLESDIARARAAADQRGALIVSAGLAYDKREAAARKHREARRQRRRP